MEPVVAPVHLVPNEEGRRPEDTPLDGRGGGVFESILDLSGSRTLQEVRRVRPEPTGPLPQRPVLVGFLEALRRATLLPVIGEASRVNAPSSFSAAHHIAARIVLRVRNGNGSGNRIGRP